MFALGRTSYRTCASELAPYLSNSNLNSSLPSQFSSDHSSQSGARWKSSEPSISYITDPEVLNKLQALSRRLHTQHYYLTEEGIPPALAKYVQRDPYSSIDCAIQQAALDASLDSREDVERVRAVMEKVRPLLEQYRETLLERKEIFLSHHSSRD